MELVLEKKLAQLSGALLAAQLAEKWAHSSEIELENMLAKRLDSVLGKESERVLGN